MTYSKWLWSEVFFVAYHLKQPVNIVKTCLSPIERRFFIDMFIDQREQENQEITKSIKK